MDHTDARLNIGIKQRGIYIFKTLSAHLTNPTHGCWAPYFLEVLFFPSAVELFYHYSSGILDVTSFLWML